MTQQFSTALRDALLNQYESTIGTAPKLQFRTGAPPANCAASSTGTLLVEMTLPSDWQAAASGGSASKSGTWSGVAAATGTAGHYRIFNSGGTTCHEQGTITQAVTLTTSSSTAAGSNVLNFTDTTGVTVGDTISGPGVVGGSTVLSKTSTTVNMSSASSLGVSSGVTITFGDTTGDWLVNNASITAGATITVDTRTLTAPGN